MANEPLAPKTDPGLASEDEYNTFYAALSETARGRAFLAEHARRQRLADTERLREAVHRLEAQGAAADPIRDELRVLVDAIRSVQSEIDAANLSMQVAKLASVVEVLRTRIEVIAAPAPAERADAPVATPQPEPAAPAIKEPAPAAAEPAAAEGSAIPEVSWFDGSRAGATTERARAAPAEATAAEPTSPLAIAFVAELAEREAASKAEDDEPAEANVIKAGRIPPPAPFEGEDFTDDPAVKAAAKSPHLDPIKALSDDERMALFT